MLLQTVNKSTLCIHLPVSGPPYMGMSDADHERRRQRGHCTVQPFNGEPLHTLSIPPCVCFSPSEEGVIRSAVGNRPVFGPGASLWVTDSVPKLRVKYMSPWRS